MTWTVVGGRDDYQIAAEWTSDNRIAWHCTCPDAIFRGSRHPAHVCKHVHGLFTLLNIDSEPHAAAPQATTSSQQRQPGKVPPACAGSSSQQRQPEQGSPTSASPPPVAA
jgi:hypothetical protein